MLSKIKQLIPVYTAGDSLPLRVGIFVSEVDTMWYCVDFPLAVDELAGGSWRKKHQYESGEKETSHEDGDINAAPPSDAGIPTYLNTFAHSYQSLD